MGRYCITMERTVRIAKWFEAEDDKQARELAEQIHLKTKDHEYEFGDSEYDYALASEDGRDLVLWG